MTTKIYTYNQRFKILHFLVKAYSSLGRLYTVKLIHVTNAINPGQTSFLYNSINQFRLCIGFKFEFYTFQFIYDFRIFAINSVCVVFLVCLFVIMFLSYL